MKIDETKYGYVYRITNLINGKTYIGQHKINKNEKFLNYMGSGRLIRYAIHKYGKENFSKEIVQYADSKTELDTLEKHSIEQELLIGKSEYNIIGSDAKLAIKLDELDLNDHDLLKWYFDDGMSYNDLSLRLNCSVPTIYNYMKKLRDTDERFGGIEQGSNRGKSKFNKEGSEKGLSIAKRKVECENCNTKISYTNYKKHLNACIKGYKASSGAKYYYLCSNTNCPKNVKNKDTFCREHANSENYGESMKQGALFGNHKRWHLNRGIVKKECILCQKLL